MHGVTVGQWLAGSSFNQGVGGSIPVPVDVSLCKPLNPEFLPVAMYTVYECHISRFGYNEMKKYFMLCVLKLHSFY